MIKDNQFYILRAIIIYYLVIGYYLYVLIMVKESPNF